jgi:FMN reductase
LPADHIEAFDRNPEIIEMTGLSIVGVSGNVTRPSRSSALVGAVLDALQSRVDADLKLIELVDAAPMFLSALTADRLDSDGKSLIRSIEVADLIVVGTPVYRASYTGALKHLFDLVRHDAFVGKPVILTATGGSQLHGLVTEHQLRPLFGFFNAFTLPTAVYATEADYRDYRVASPAVHDRIERAVTEAVGVLKARLAVTFGSPARAARLPAAATA